MPHPKLEWRPVWACESIDLSCPAPPAAIPPDRVDGPTSGAHSLVFLPVFLVTLLSCGPGAPAASQDASRPPDTAPDILLSEVDTGPRDAPRWSDAALTDAAADASSPPDAAGWPDAAFADAAPDASSPPDAAAPDAPSPPDAAAPDASSADGAAADAGCGQVAPPSPTGAATQLLAPVSPYASQYSPWVLHEPGWASYLMYYCKNTPIAGVWRDRIWRAESWTNGLGDWDPGYVVIEGELGQDDDLSCSPGVVIDGSGTWHMYYVAADRNSSMELYLYHAVSQAPGITWTKLGKVGGQFPQPWPGYLETPSPMLLGGRIVLYVVGSRGRLYRSESTDGHNFSAPVLVESPEWAAHGRVRHDATGFHYVYATHPNGCCDPPTEIRYSWSQDGMCFPDGVLLFRAAGSGWDRSRIWSPDALIRDGFLYLYYAANGDDTSCSPACDAAHSCQAGSCVWWGAASSIGIRVYLLP